MKSVAELRKQWLETVNEARETFEDAFRFNVLIVEQKAKELFAVKLSKVEDVNWTVEDLDFLTSKPYFDNLVAPKESKDED